MRGGRGLRVAQPTRLEERKARRPRVSTRRTTSVKARGGEIHFITTTLFSMKTAIFAAAAAVLALAPTSRADVGTYEEEVPAPRHVYTEREYVERVPAYREEVRVYRP